ncbi:hypothetical protein VP01_3980g2 [Puccinia sorghi]|uniref:Uncharacterized protein n=1 Tax=Puccinia sorghi TaxID=27349 RepID=A0A0L6USA4_9BASI|nr:hypothetical protein VP01_3980g2 [Puccinia sorghi]
MARIPWSTGPLRCFGTVRVLCTVTVHQSLVESLWEKADWQLSWGWKGLDHAMTKLYVKQSGMFEPLLSRYRGGCVASGDWIVAGLCAKAVERRQGVGVPTMRHDNKRVKPTSSRLKPTVKPAHGPANNHNLLPITYPPDAGAFPPWLRDPESQQWFNIEAYNQLLDNIPPTQSWSSTPDQEIQHPSPDENFFRANTLSSLTSPYKTSSHELSESGPFQPNIPGIDNTPSVMYILQAADHEFFSPTIQNFNGKIAIPPRPVAMKRTSRPSNEGIFRQLNTKSSKQLNDNSESELKEFGWISLLGFIPNLQRDIPLNKLDLVIDKIKPWDRPQETQLQSSAILKELIVSNQLSPVDAIHRAGNLCKEIRLRHGNLLATFTSPADSDEVVTLVKSNEKEGVIFQEKSNLLNWLKDQLYNPPTREDSEYLSLRSTIIDYLKIDPHSKNSQQIKWETVKGEKRRQQKKFVSLHQAMTTQAAIKILEAYLKSTNLPKWNNLFTKERPLLNLFKYIRSIKQHSDFSKFRERVPGWASSGFFPWKEPLDRKYKQKLGGLFQNKEIK